MSHELTAMAWRTPVGSPYERLVLLRICDHARDDNLCAWPSVASIMEFTNLSRRTVQRAIKGLEQSGVIVREKRPGRAQTDVWHIDNRKLGIVDPWRYDAVREKKGVPPTLNEEAAAEWVSAGPEKGACQADKGAHQAPGTSKEPGNEPVSSPLPPKGGEGADLDLLLHLLWECTPRAARRRTTQKRVRAQLARLKPSPQVARQMVQWLRRRVKDDDWSKQDGQFMPALDRVVKDRGWEDETPEETERVEEMQRAPHCCRRQPMGDWWGTLRALMPEETEGMDEAPAWEVIPSDWQDAAIEALGNEGIETFSKVS